MTDLARNHHMRPMLWGLLLLQGTAMSMNLGKDGVSKTDEFSEKFQKGRGVIFNPKIYIADFGPLNRAFSA